MGWRAARIAFADVAGLADALGCAEPLAWALVRRGLADPGEARAFLAADGPLAPAEDMPGVGAAADRLARAARRGEPIVVHGDYDCDGITSTALLVRALAARGARVSAFLPSRFTDGYGVSEATVARLAGEGCRVLCCVDCGTTAVDPLTRASELGVDVIVLDHHLAGGLRPPGILVNPALGPARPGEGLPAAAGVVFRVTRALAARLDGDGLAPDPEEGLDLVALATVADAVPLVGENRRLVARGLAAMRGEGTGPPRPPRPAVAALCRAAGTDPRALTARTLAFSLAPTINAAGRLGHPERALALLLAPDADTAEPLARDLWDLNLRRRDIEAAITAEAVAQVEASPPGERSAGAIVAAGDGWHEGVVGIVASRLVERFERPAIVIARDGASAKGSGRSLPGVDLHALVGAASGPLTRWGGHAGAVGLELPAAAVGRFKEGLLAAAEGARAAIARAAVRRVDAVVATGELTLPTAEALEALAPFGRGNPPVHLLLPATRLESPGRVGAEGRHLSLRVRSGGAHTRAVGWRMGDRAGGLDPERRYDAVVGLEVDRWQGLVGTKVVVERLDALEAAPELAPGLCAQACDVDCRARLGDAEVRALALATGADDDQAPARGARTVPPPLGVRDRRAQAAPLAVLAGLAGADAGAVAVVADVARRREALGAALEPLRLGVEVAALGGARCAPGALAERLARGGGDGPSILAMLDYPRLAEVDLPGGTHLVLVDPPAHPDDAEAVRRAAAGRWLHVAYGPAETAFALEVAEAEWELRAVVTDLWRALRDGAPLCFGAGLERTLLGEGPIMRPPRVAARALRVLAELGLVALTGEGVVLEAAPTRRELADSPTYAACAARLDEARAFLARAETLDFVAESAIEIVSEAA